MPPRDERGCNEGERVKPAGRAWPEASSASTAISVRVSPAGYSRFAQVVNEARMRLRLKGEESFESSPAPPPRGRVL
jgi:hypothetical protein